MAHDKLSVYWFSIPINLVNCITECQSNMDQFQIMARNLAWAMGGGAPPANFLIDLISGAGPYLLPFLEPFAFLH